MEQKTAGREQRAAGRKRTEADGNYKSQNPNNKQIPMTKDLGVRCQVSVFSRDGDFSAQCSDFSVFALIP
jgi:hypothetical protein